MGNGTTSAGGGGGALGGGGFAAGVGGGAESAGGYSQAFYKRRAQQRQAMQERNAAAAGVPSSFTDPTGRPGVTFQRDTSVALPPTDYTVGMPQAPAWNTFPPQAPSRPDYTVGMPQAPGPNIFPPAPQAPPRPDYTVGVGTPSPFQPTFPPQAPQPSGGWGGTSMPWGQQPRMGFLGDLPRGDRSDAIRDRSYEAPPQMVSPPSFGEQSRGRPAPTYQYADLSRVPAPPKAPSADWMLSVPRARTPVGVKEFARPSSREARAQERAERLNKTLRSLLPYEGFHSDDPDHIELTYLNRRFAQPGRGPQPAPPVSQPAPPVSQPTHLVGGMPSFPLLFGKKPLVAGLMEAYMDRFRDLKGIEPGAPGVPEFNFVSKSDRERLEKEDVEIAAAEKEDVERNEVAAAEAVEEGEGHAAAAEKEREAALEAVAEEERKKREKARDVAIANGKIADLKGKIPLPHHDVGMPNVDDWNKWPGFKKQQKKIANMPKGPAQDVAIKELGIKMKALRDKSQRKLDKKKEAARKAAADKRRKDAMKHGGGGGGGGAFNKAAAEQAQRNWEEAMRLLEAARDAIGNSPSFKEAEALLMAIMSGTGVPFNDEMKAKIFGDISDRLTRSMQEEVRGGEAAIAAAGLRTGPEASFRGAAAQRAAQAGAAATAQEATRMAEANAAAQRQASAQAGQLAVQKAAQENAIRQQMAQMFATRKYPAYV